MIYPKQNSGDQGSANPVTFSLKWFSVNALFTCSPLPIIHIIGNFMRIWSVYSMYHYLSQTGASVVLFIFTCLAPSAIIFLALQQPWKGRPLSNTQVVPSIINGGITALYFILWGKGLKSCGPVRAIMAEYSGAVLVLSAVLYGRTGHVWKKHLMVAGGCIIIMEIVYKMDFSVLGFLIYSTILGFGIYQATSLELFRKDSLQNSDLSNGIFGDQIQLSSLPT